jgi:signal transduction histidine kinase
MGFDVAEAKAKGGLGMRSLESRVKYINGQLDIEAMPGTGTTVTIEIPIHQEVIFT